MANPTQIRPTRIIPQNGGNEDLAPLLAPNPKAKPSKIVTITKAGGRGVLKMLGWMIETALFIGVALALVSYFWGTTTINATLDGKPVKTQVWIDGQYVGDTPYVKRLGFGEFDIEIFPPDGVDTNETQWNATFWSVVRGLDIEEDFTTATVDDQ